jgi:hypothetical protein
MDAYVYKAALWCGPCIIKALVAERKAAPSAIDIPPAEALEQIVSANGFTSEGDYDSDDLPKGPYADGGGKADTPQHCDGCRQFLENPLTGMASFMSKTRSAAASRPRTSATRLTTRSSIGRNSAKTSSTSVGSFLKH